MNPSEHSWLPLVLDLEAVPASIPTAAATHLFVTVLVSGRPIGTVLVPAPFDPYPGFVLRDLVIQELTDQIVIDKFHSTIERSDDPYTREVTVAVCTRDRPEELRRCLRSLEAIRQPPLRLVVVENRDATSEVRKAAADHGAVYICEPAPGLDRARNRGIEASDTELVLFTDDDVEVEPGWARALANCFADPLVAAATGLVLPARLDTRARILSELYSSHGRGTRRRLLDGALVSPAVAGAAGVGASMAFRVSFLRQIGGFPEELDAGMPTGTGGDTYAFNRVLRAGRRIVYEPMALSYHWHRASDEELVRALQANGKGILGYISHILVSDRDPSGFTSSVPAAVAYLAKKIVRATLGRAGSPPFSLAWSELMGALRGPSDYAKARASVAEWGRVALHPPGPAPWVEPFLDAPPPGFDEKPFLSVVVPTRGRRDSVVSLLRCLDQQDYPRDKFEVLVVIDGDIDGTEDAIYAADLAVAPKVVVLDGRFPNGPAAARNAGASAASGDVLVFLDDDVTPLHNSLLSAHGALQSSSNAAVAGACVVGLADSRRFFEQRARNWWVDHVGRMTRSVAPAFTDLCTGNFSISKVIFEQHGGFADLRRREDWEFAYRLGKSGVPLVLAPEAGVSQVLEVDVLESLVDRIGEGAGDAGFMQLHPEVMRWLPLGAWPEMQRRRRVVRILLNHPAWSRPMLRLGVRILRLLERAGIRHSWSRLLDSLNFVAYWTGVAERIGGEEAWLDAIERSRSHFMGQPLTVDLASDDGNTLQMGSTFDVLVSYEGKPLGLAPPLLGGLPWDRARFVEAAKSRFHDELVVAAVEGLTR